MGYFRVELLYCVAYGLWGYKWKADHTPINGHLTLLEGILSQFSSTSAVCWRDLNAWIVVAYDIKFLIRTQCLCVVIIRDFRFVYPHSSVECWTWLCLSKVLIRRRLKHALGQNTCEHKNKSCSVELVSDRGELQTIVTNCSRIMKTSVCPNCVF